MIDQTDQLNSLISGKMETCLFLFLFLPLILIFHFQKNKKIKKTRKPPGPPGLPFIGNLHQFDSAKPHELLRKLSYEYGPLVSLRLGNVPVLAISSTKTAKEALRDHDLTFSGRPQLVSQQKLSYNRLDVAFSPYGEYWREVRKISVVHLLSLKRVQSFHPIIEDEVSLLTKKISKLCSSSHVVNLSSMAKNLTSTVICRIAFGKKYDEEGHEKKRFDQILCETQALFAGFFVSDYLPSLSWVDRLSGMFARLEKNFRELDLFYQELIEDHLNPNRPEARQDDVLDLLIQMKNDQSSSFHLSWDHIKAMLMDIFTGGTDTSAAVIVWAMTALMQSPSAMKRVQSEIRELVDMKGAVLKPMEAWLCPHHHELPVALVWISFTHLPVHLFQRGPLMSIASLIGRPLRIDTATHSLSRPSVARVCVEVNLLRNLPKRVWIGHGDKGFWQTVTYEDLPSHCTFFSSLGHESANCSPDQPQQPSHVWKPKETQTAEVEGSGLSMIEKSMIPTDIQHHGSSPNPAPQHPRAEIPHPP